MTTKPVVPKLIVQPGSALSEAYFGIIDLRTAMAKRKYVVQLEDVDRLLTYADQAMKFQRELKQKLINGESLSD